MMLNATHQGYEQNRIETVPGKSWVVLIRLSVEEH